MNDRNSAISTNNSTNLALAKVYTAVQSFSDIITTNITSTNSNCNICNVNQSIISYNSLPLFLSQKYIGFMTAASSLKFVSVYNTYINLASLAIIPGVFLIQYQINYNYSISNLLSWWSYGIGTNTLNLDIQSCKNYGSSSTSLPYSVSNSYMYTATSSQTIYLNTFLSDYDNTVTVANLANFSIAAKLSICRIA